MLCAGEGTAVSEEESEREREQIHCLREGSPEGFMTVEQDKQCDFVVRSRLHVIGHDLEPLPLSRACAVPCHETGHCGRCTSQLLALDASKVDLHLTMKGAISFLLLFFPCFARVFFKHFACSSTKLGQRGIH